MSNIYPTRSGRPASIRAAARGFTLIELLVVIGIIALLAGILIPVIGAVQRAARNTDTKAQVTRIAKACEAYYLEFQSYPGPLSNDWIETGGPTAGDQAIGNFTGTVTMSENLVLGLIGGLKNSGGQGGNTFINYDKTLVYGGKGPQALGSFNSKSYTPYIDLNVKELTPDSANGQFVDNMGNKANDSNVPEFIDHYGEFALPILYMRARVGAPGVMSKKQQDETGSGTGPYQYDQAQIAPYVNTAIGLTGPYYKTANGGSHGLTVAGTISETIQTMAASPNQKYNALNHYLPYFTQVVGNPSTNLNSTPKQKDAFILIAAGDDRVYGTQDDICNITVH